MKSYLTAVRLVTKLQMLRSGKKGKTFVLVEGITDFRLYGKLFSQATCEVIIGESKQNVVAAMSACQQQHIGGIIGIVDADFWHMDGKAIEVPSLFMTDAHDLESMMIASRAYDNVLLEYGDLKKLARFEERRKKELRMILLENVARIGYLRKLSLQEHYEWGFNELDFKAFTYVSELEVQEEQLITYMLFRSKKQKDKKGEHIAATLHELMQPTDDLWQVCCGHDLMALLTIGLVHLFGNYNAKKMTSGQLEGCFRLAYQETFFKDTHLYKDLKKWEDSEEIYRLFE